MIYSNFVKAAYALGLRRDAKERNPMKTHRVPPRIGNVQNGPNQDS